MNSLSEDPQMRPIRCGKCQTAFEVHVQQSGQHAVCPSCQVTIVVPNLGPTSPSPSLVAPTPALGGAPALGGVPGAGGNSAAARAGDPSVGDRWQEEATGAGQRSVGFQGQQSAQASASLSAGRVVGNSLLDLVKEGGDTAGHRLYRRMTAEIAKIFVGQDELVLGTLVGLFSSGHVLIESVPGLGKTLFVRTLGQVLGCDFGRIQFTPDLMPSDVTGTPIFNVKTQEFRFHPGPVFTQLLLADEINRAPAKTHAALLETMQEYRVTIDSQIHLMPRPFFVLATQNPIESEGTYNLPEAQLDRFMFLLKMDYPSMDEETAILRLHGGQKKVDDQLTSLERVTTPEEISALMQSSESIRVEDSIVDYIAKLVRQTRHWPQIHLGASPRAGITLMRAGRTLAMFAGRDFVVPDDISQLLRPALRHRIILTPEAEVEGLTADEILTDVLRSVEVPRME